MNNASRVKEQVSGVVFGTSEETLQGQGCIERGEVEYTEGLLNLNNERGVVVVDYLDSGNKGRE